MNELIKQYETEMGEKAIYRVDGCIDYHTLKYVTWLEKRVADRALLEEAVLELEGLRDHINQDVMHYVWNEEDKKRIDDFLTRAKERLGK